MQLSAHQLLGGDHVRHLHDNPLNAVVLGHLDKKPIVCPSDLNGSATAGSASNACLNVRFAAKGRMSGQDFGDLFSKATIFAVFRRTSHSTPLSKEPARNEISPSF